MSKKFRDSLLPIFIILFIFLTAITSLYASGYKFNLSWPIRFNRLLQKTGVLIVETKPTQAVVYLNDKPQQNLSLNPWKKDYLTTPAKVRNILPGEYKLRLEVDGYWPYTQKITINSGETTFVKDVNLFLENIPTLVSACPESNLLLSIDNKYIYVQTGQKIITLKTETARSLPVTDQDPTGWLKNNKLLIAGTIFDPTKENNDINYADLIGPNVDSWRFEDETGYLYYKNNNTINQFKIDNQSNSVLLSGGNYLDYKPSQNKLLILSEKNNQITLEALFPASSKKEQWLLPASGQYSFAENLANYLTVYDKQNQTLYLFDETNIGAGPITIRNIKNWALIDKDSIIYTNDFEIYTFSFSNQHSNLITRRSEKIENIIWNASGNYLIFSGLNTLNVFDFKNYNTISLFTAEKITSPAFDSKNSILYFWARIGQQEGIYKMLLQ